MTSSPKPGPDHQCESWQIRRDADGARYCAACGERLSADVRPVRDGETEVLL